MRDRDRGGNSFERPGEYPATGNNGAYVPSVHGRRGVDRAGGIDAPIDLVAVQADDELVTALSAGMAVSAPGRGGYDADDRMVAMLVAWRAEIDAEPIPQLVDVDTALAAIAAASASRPRRNRFLAPLAGAAALVVLAMGGMSVGAQSAHPGDPLFVVTKVLYSEKAESRQAAADVQVGLTKLKASLARGDTTAANQEVVALNALVPKVAPEDQAPMAAQQVSFLSAKLAETPSGTPTDPSAPLKDGTLPPPDPTRPPSGPPVDVSVLPTPTPTPTVVAPTSAAPTTSVEPKPTAPATSTPPVEPTTTTPPAPTTTPPPTTAPPSTTATAAPGATTPPPAPPS